MTASAVVSTRSERPMTSPGWKSAPASHAVWPGMQSSASLTSVWAAAGKLAASRASAQAPREVERNRDVQPKRARALADGVRAWSLEFIACEQFLRSSRGDLLLASRARLAAVRTFGRLLELCPTQ